MNVKELTIEQKAKRYDEAIEELRGLLEGIHEEKCDIMEEDIIKIFPELIESEDERIRKEIIAHIKWCEDSGYCAKEETTRWITFLEKQGEQKPADKVEPKFHEGDWLVNIEYGNVVRVLEVLENNYRLDCGGDTIGTLCAELVDNDYRLWTIQDAKDGDVLHSIGWDNDCIFIFNGLDNWKFDEPNGDRAVATGYCCLSVSADKMEFGIQGPDCIETNTVKPSTKIQRNLLFQKMKEAGYEWDAEKKELKKIEQKQDVNIVDEHYDEMLGEEPVSEFMNIESMIKSYKQRLISQANGMKNSPLIDMCLASYKHGINETLDTLNLSNVERTAKNWKEPVSKEIGDYDHKAVMEPLCPQLKEEPTIPDIVDEHYDEMLGEEPVSEELEEAADEYAPDFSNSIASKAAVNAIRDAFKAGAKWQKEQIMVKAFDGEVLENYDGKVIKYDDTILDEKLSDCKVFDKVKIIVIKEG